MQRRTFIKESAFTAFSVSIFGTLHWNGSSFEGDSTTTTDILGPFYRPNAPMRTNLRLPGTKGTPIVLKGTIVGHDGKTPVKNAMVEICHCDEREVYDNTGNNTFQQGGGVPKAVFTLQEDGSIKVDVSFSSTVYKGVKYLKYS